AAVNRGLPADVARLAPLERQPAAGGHAVPLGAAELRPLQRDGEQRDEADHRALLLRLDLVVDQDDEVLAAGLLEAVRAAGARQHRRARRDVYRLPVE